MGLGWGQDQGGGGDRAGVSLSLSGSSVGC